MADRHKNFAELAKTERLGIDFAIRSTIRTTGQFAVIAPHGGKIEFGTSEIAEAIAGVDHSFYAFEGRKPNKNRDLHLTSTRFDEPTALILLSSYQRAISIHGEGDTDSLTYVGGRDEALVKSVSASLTEKGFRVGKHENPLLQGSHAANVVNKTMSGAGVQLELSAGLRESLLPVQGGERKRSAAFDLYVEAIRSALESVGH